MSTIKDVARQAGVGVATVSRAISGRGSVSPRSLELVTAAARALDYRPSAIARALSLKRSGALGVYVPELASFFHSSIVSAADKVARAHGTHLVVACGSPMREGRQEAITGVDFLLARDCDGIVIAGHELSDRDLLALRERMRHFVVINRRIPRLREQCFAPDHREGGRIAARALLNRGHRRIALLEGPARAPDNRQRLEGFREELARHGLAPALVFEGDFSRERGWQVAQELMQRIDRDRPPAQRCSAVFCANDRMAMGLTSRLWLGGWRVPEDLSVIGYDDDDFAPFTTPPLSTVRMPMTELTEQATAALLTRCYGIEAAPRPALAPALASRLSVLDGPFAPLGPAPLTTVSPPDETLFPARTKSMP
ncbi:MAG: LacI family DNA-binding transcriptional regulator [Burkholderiales bacterium]|nr:LacI family DNA-binding transcriptional regulator [Burkholderiales bacterium]